MQGLKTPSSLPNHIVSKELRACALTLIVLTVLVVFGALKKNNEAFSESDRLKLRETTTTTRKVPVIKSSEHTSTMSGRVLSTLFAPGVKREMFNAVFTRNLSVKKLTQTVALVTNDEVNTKHLRNKPSLAEYESEGRPLSIMLCWLMAKNNAVNKYAKFYLDKGYDVLTVRITPTQLLWPKLCTPIIDNEIMPILQSSDHSQKLIHGFSVGGYVFAQMLKRLKDDPEKYRQLQSTFFAQIWDSVVDVNGVSIGVSKSVFMNNQYLQIALQKYIDFHMKIFYNVATKYYDQAHEYFYNQPLKVPALFLCSTTDQISTIDVIQALTDTWSPMGIKSIKREWEDTHHVGHMHRHPIEYKEMINSFLNGVGGNTKGYVPSKVVPGEEEVAGAFTLNSPLVYSK